LGESGNKIWWLVLHWRWEGENETVNDEGNEEEPVKALGGSRPSRKFDGERGERRFRVRTEV